jgi:hypothetical protein
MYKATACFIGQGRMGFLIAATNSYMYTLLCISMIFSLLESWAKDFHDLLGT